MLIADCTIGIGGLSLAPQESRNASDLVSSGVGNSALIQVIELQKYR